MSILFTPSEVEGLMEFINHGRDARATIAFSTIPPRSLRSPR